MKECLENTEKQLKDRTEQFIKANREIEINQMETEDYMCRAQYKDEELKQLRSDQEEMEAKVKELTELQAQHGEEVESNLKRISELHGEAQTHKDAIKAKQKELKELEEQMEALKVDTEDQIQDLKQQLADALKSKGKMPSAQKAPSEKGSESKASQKSLKPPPVKEIKEVEVIKEVIKEVVKQVP